MVRRIFEFQSFLGITILVLFQVVVLAGSLLDAADRLLKKGLHPTAISEAFQKAAVKSVEILTNMAIPVDLSDREKLLQVKLYNYMFNILTL